MAENKKEELKDSEIIDIKDIDNNKANAKDGGKEASKQEEKGSSKLTKKYTKITKKKSRLFWVILAIIIVIILFFFLKNKKSSEPIINDNKNTAEVTDNSIYETATATGTLYSGDARSVTTMLNEASKINNLYVSVGDYVSEGDTLVEFSTEGITKSISEKQADISLQKKQDAVSAKDAERDYFRSYDVAATSLRESADDVSQKLKDLYEACDAYSKAKSKYEEIKKERDEKLDDAHGEAERKSIEESYKSRLESQQSSIDNAYMNQEKAQKTYSDAVKSQAKDVASQQNTLSKADSTYQMSGITSGKEVTNLQRQLENLQDSLEEYVVKAPIAGVVTAVNVSEGNSFKDGTVLTIQNDDVYTVTVKIDEYDINKVKAAYKQYCKNIEEGNTDLDIGTAKITTSATDDQSITYSGHITEIAPTSVATTNYSTQSSDSSNNSTNSSQSSSAANYEVKLVVDGLDNSYLKNTEIENKLSEDEALELLMIGMTAKVNIVIDESEKGALTVPYNAVTKIKDNDESPYRYFVEVVTNSDEMGMPEMSNNGITVEKNDTFARSDNSSKRSNNHENAMGGPGNGMRISGDMRNRPRGNRGITGLFSNIFSKDKDEQQDEQRIFTKKVEVILGFENDYYCSIMPKIAGQIKAGDQVILIDDESESTDFPMGPGMGGY